MAKRSAQSEFSSGAETADLLDELREELSRLRTSIDQLREDLALVTGRPRQPPSRRPILRITSLPKDPTAPNFFRRINAVPAEQLDAMRAELVRPGGHQDEDDPV